MKARGTPIPVAEATLPGLLRHWARTTPAALALREKQRGVWRRFTWAEYEDLTIRIARGLHALGFQAGDRAIIVGEGCPAWMASDLAIQALSGIAVGIYPTNPWVELQYIAGHCKAKVAFCVDQEQVDKVIEARRQGGGLEHLKHIVCVDMKGMRGYDEPGLMSLDALQQIGVDQSPAGSSPRWQWDAWLDALRADQTAVLVYTSGTTGPPKGAKLSHTNMVFATSALTREYGLNQANYSVVCYLPLCHVAERSFSIVGQLLTGGVVNYAESVDTVARDLREIAPTVFLGVPRIWEKLRKSVLVQIQDATPFQRRVFQACYQLTEQASSTVAPWGRKIALAVASAAVFVPLRRRLGLNRTIGRFCGGASVSPETLRFFEILGVPVAQAYGMTESGGLAFVQTDRARQPGHVGLPIEGLEYRIAEDGELLMRGPSIFQGYLDDTKGTQDVLSTEGWLHSGDIVERNENGEIRIVDRKKAILITSGGKNVAPSEIENALKESMYIREAIVLGNGRNYLTALIQVDLETTGQWAQERGVAYTNYRSLSQLAVVRDLVNKDVQRVNSRFARVENIRKFHILEKELDHDDGEVTATQKIRRSFIEKKFAREIAILYAGDSA